MIKIGAKDWVRDLRLKTEPLGPEFWSRFHPATKREVNQVATQTGRELDPEFCEFYRSVGYGEFRDHRGYIGCIFSPSEILQCLPNPIFFITGSMSPGNEWAPLEQQTELWLSRGRSNPDPEQFTDEVLTLEGVKLYDLLQFGNDGLCCYHQLYVGPEPAPLRYCLLTDSQTMEDRKASFSEALNKIMDDYLERSNLAQQIARPNDEERE